MVGFGKEEEFEGKINLEDGWLGREGGGGGGDRVEIVRAAAGRRMHSSSWTRVRGSFWCASMTSGNYELDYVVKL